MIEQWFRGVSAAEIYDRSRAGLRVDPDGEHAERVRCLDGAFDLFVDRRDRALARPVAVDGCWEIALTRALARHVPAGVLALDVGASVGYFSMLLAKFGAASVVAVEPHDRSRELLVRSIAANGLGDRIAVDGRAAWDVSGEALSLEVPSDRWASSSCGEYWQTPDPGEPVARQPCASVTVDDLLDELGIDAPIGIAVVDVEGAEARVWRGMRRAWARSPGCVIVAEAAGAPGREFVAALRADGLRLRLVNALGDVRDVTEADLRLRDAASEDLITLWAHR